MEWPKVVRELGLALLFVAAAALAVVVGLAAERLGRGPDREACHELVIHHFERSS